MTKGFFSITVCRGKNSLLWEKLLQIQGQIEKVDEVGRWSIALALMMKGWVTGNCFFSSKSRQFARYLNLEGGYMLFSPDSAEGGEL
ncbi:hypothetical protein Ancab_037977, partial [Ancistrocladus abbreviatus]